MKYMTDKELTGTAHEHTGEIRYCIGKDTYCTTCIPPMDAKEMPDFIKFLTDKAYKRGVEDMAKKVLYGVYHAKIGDATGCHCCDSILTSLRESGVDVTETT